MIHLREFINANQPVYKIGKTKQLDSRKRIQSYPKSSCLIIQIGCANTDKKETELKTLFKNKYLARVDLGSEYFQGNYVAMMKDIIDNCIGDLTMIDEEDKMDVCS